MIKAKVIKHSSHNTIKDLVTFELEYPRFIHSELMTHRVFSRNAASSRAIPIAKMIEQVKSNPAMPVHWGVNQPGMQAVFEHQNIKACKKAWVEAAESAVKSAQSLLGMGLHKQIVNRVLEPFQTMKTIVTSTEWDNFFELRCHKDAQPEIKALADLMKSELDWSSPQLLEKGEWHLPYVTTIKGEDEEFRFYIFDGDSLESSEDDSKMELSLEDAKKVSASCCAQVSYRDIDNSLEKALKIFDILVAGRPIHASPFEHVATPWSSSVSRYKTANFNGWVQYRSMIEGDMV